MSGDVPGPFSAIEAQLGRSALISALTVITVVGFAVSVVAMLLPNSRAALYAVLVLQLTMGVNALSHLAAAVFLFKGYGPGLVTALVINAPFTIYVFRRAFIERWIDRRRFVMMSIGAVLLNGPVLVGGLWLLGAATNRRLP